ncbi:MAG: cytidylate kinase family protein [Candidatus Berkelbacteria bacterium]|nr:cytidylate kinase family protein [Candidatus Berkelbacteria bacterium]
MSYHSSHTQHEVDTIYRLYELRKSQTKQSLHLPAPAAKSQRKVLVVSGSYLLPVWQVASEVADYYKTVCYGRDIVDVMANDDGIRSAIFEKLDDKSIKSLTDQINYLAKDYGRNAIVEDTEDRRFTRSTLLLVAQSIEELKEKEKPIVLVGSGFNFILPHAVSIRFVASPESRAKFFRKEISQIKHIDNEKEKWIRHRFNRHYDDVNYHDWVNELNLDRMQSVESLTDEMVHITLSETYHKFPHQS